MRQETRFCTTPDNVRVAYAVVGKGPPLVKAANYLSHLEFDWQSPVWRHWLETMSADSRLIRYDERGCGLSDWNVPDFSFDAWIRDLESVVNAAGLEQFPLLEFPKVELSRSSTRHAIQIESPNSSCMADIRG